MTSRERALGNVKVGDIFHAEGDHGGSLICLATSITDTTIHARTITHQLEFKFDRRTGLGEEPEYRIKGTIDSVAQLPPDVRATILDLDRKHRSQAEGRLTTEEKRALVFVADFYPAHPI